MNNLLLSIVNCIESWRLILLALKFIWSFQKNVSGARSEAAARYLRDGNKIAVIPNLFLLGARENLINYHDDHE